MADLRREYGIDLLDLWRGRLSFYELCAYLAGLSGDTATGRLLRDLPEETEGWGLVPVLLGALIDAVRGQWADEPVESCLPKALLEERPEIQGPQGSLEMQPDGAVTALIGAPHQFVSAHGR